MWKSKNLTEFNLLKINFDFLPFDFQSIILVCYVQVDEKRDCQTKKIPRKYGKINLF